MGKCKKKLLKFAKIWCIIILENKKSVNDTKIEGEKIL